MEHTRPENAVSYDEVVASELRMRLLLEQLPDTMLFVVDDELRYQLATGSGLVVQGALDWQGKTVAETSNEHNRPILEGLYRRALAGEKSTATITTSVGQRVTEVTAIPLVHGSTRQALVVARDTSELRGREMALRLVTEQFSQVIHESPSGLALTDLTGRLALVNSAFGELFDGEGQSLLDRDAAELLPMGGAPGENWVRDLIESGRDRLTAHLVLEPSPAASAGVPGQLPTAHAHHGPDRYVLDAQQSKPLAARDNPDAKRATITAVVLRDAAGEPTSVLINAYDTSEQHRYHQHVAYLASHDSLSGLVNRVEFERLLSQHLERCRQTGDTGAVLVIDLDNFREINNSLGHAAGDDVIVSMASMLSRWLWSTDVIARIGADEFAVLLTVGGRQQAEGVVRTLVRLVRDGFRHLTTHDGSVADLERLQIRLTTSIGAVEVTSQASASELLSDADLAMFEAKRGGRNGYRFFDSSQVLAARESNQTNWTEKILGAIDGNRLVLHAQPILDLATNEVTSLELLVRMVDDDGELIAPGDFIPAAEASGLAVMLDEWVITRALEHLRRLQSSVPGITINVNLSGRSVGNPEFADFIERRIAESGVDASGLVLEVTETAAVSSIDNAQAFMARLTALGCVFALDDFGVGYGSFYYLKHLPFGILKLDGEFVSGRVRDPLDHLIVSSLVSIGKSLGMKTVAEFVEDEASLELLRELGVDGAQGYHIARPAPLEQFFPQLAGYNG